MNRKWRIRLAIVGGALLLSVLAAVLAGKYWLLPFVLRRQASAALGVRWEGKVTLAGIDFSWTGPLNLRRVVLRDAAGRAAGIMRMLNPIEHAREPESVWRYGVESYVVAADVYRLPGRTGQGGWSWYTDSAAWMYRAWVEEILGLKLRGETMQIAPVIPNWWDGFQMSYRHGEALYEIQVENPDHCECGVAWVELDGQHMGNGVIPLTRDLIKHHVLVRLGQ